MSECYVVLASLVRVVFVCFFFFKQKTAYEMRISDWSSDVCSSDLHAHPGRGVRAAGEHRMDRLDIARIIILEDRDERAACDLVGDAERADAGDADPGGGELSQRLAIVRLDIARHRQGELAVAVAKRSEERRVGKEGVSTCRARG